MTSLIGLLLAGLALLLLGNAVYSRRDWSLQNIQKGLAGEALIGDITERALLKSHGLYVAHDVATSTANNNIDHVVATPTMVLVVETKYQYLQKQAFAKTLRSIRNNVEFIEDFLEIDSNVLGCLVLAKETKPIKRTEYDRAGPKVRVFNTKKYEEFLIQIANGDQVLPNNVYSKIEELAFSHPYAT